MAKTRSFDPISKAKEKAVYVNDPEREDLVAFFKSSLPILDKMPLALNVHKVVAKALSERVFCSSHSEENDWKDIASKLGCEDSDRLKLINYRSRRTESLPFYTFITKDFSKRNDDFGFFVKVLIEQKRYDLLTILKPFAEARLKNPNGNISFDDLVELKAPDLFNKDHSPSDDLDNEVMKHSSSNSNGKDISTHSFEYNERPCLENCSKGMHKGMKLKNPNKSSHLNALSGITQTCCSERVKGASTMPEKPNSAVHIDEKINNDGTVSGRRPNIDELEIESSSTVQNIVSSIPMPVSFGKLFEAEAKEDDIKVFITHSSDAYERALGLSETMKHEFGGFYVTLQGDLYVQVALHQNQSLCTRECIEKFDFVIPLISQQYLRDISFCEDPDEIELNRQWVRLFFQNYQNNYINDQCLNYKIVPVILNDVPPREVKRYIEFRVYHKETNIERFVNIMKKIKEKNRLKWSH